MAFEHKMTRKTLNSFEMAVAPGTVLLFEGPERVRLVIGKAWIRSLSATEVLAPYGQLQLRPEDEVLLSRQPTELQIRALTGQVVFRRRGIAKSEVLAQGFETMLGPMRVGFADVGWPQSYDWSAVSQDLTSFYASDATALRQKLQVLKPLWQQALTESVQVSQRAATRSIALARASEAQRLAQAQRDHQETQRLRRIYRERYFNP
jgi:hypothetical protein